MSLRPTGLNRVCGIMHSAEDWARHALGADRVVGVEGFENFASGSWRHCQHYKYINKTRPELSEANALPEMAEYHERLAADIMRHAKELDQMIMRFEKMTQQMRDVMEEDRLQKDQTK